MSRKIELYGDSISGNCYKLQLACAQLDIDYKWHEIDIMAGESRSDEFLAMNPNGRVPLMALPDGSDLAGISRFEKANDYPQFRLWLRRVEQQGGFVPMRKKR